MILRRISQAIRRQDWFTVLIEIAIVVIGLLIGLQINNWNEARADRVQENAFIERLVVDVDRVRLQLKEFVKARENRLNSIAKVENLYFGEAEVEPVEEFDCVYLANMHLITLPPVAVPSITEAFTAGRIDLLSEIALIQALIVVNQSEDRLRTIIDDLKNESPNLSKKYPEAISWIRATGQQHVGLDSEVFATEGYRSAAQCHFLETTPDKTFLSGLVRGLQTNRWYVTFLYRHLHRLDELAEVLADLTNSIQSEKQLCFYAE